MLVSPKLCEWRRKCCCCCCSMTETLGNNLVLSFRFGDPKVPPIKSTASVLKAEAGVLYTAGLIPRCSLSRSNWERISGFWATMYVVGPAGCCTPDIGCCCCWLSPKTGGRSSLGGFGGAFSSEVDDANYSKKNTQLDNIFLHALWFQLLLRNFLWHSCASTKFPNQKIMIIGHVPQDIVWSLRFSLLAISFCCCLSSCKISLWTKIPKENFISNFRVKQPNPRLNFYVAFFNSLIRGEDLLRCNIPLCVLRNCIMHSQKLTITFPWDD